ncbi:type III-B CRISPR module RAMP protein Cmr1 [Thermoflexus hugenholtzii]
MESREWKFKALTDIWTGDVERRGERLIYTGLLGSIRWWFEVLVRGLGGKACDPTAKDVRCPAEGKAPRDPGHHCVVCELFGCTGWARKFRFEVLDERGQPKQDQIKAGEIFILRFTELRPICEKEWCLLDLTLRLIAEYGAIGGRTVFKPTDEKKRQSALHHKDFGLISIIEEPPRISYDMEDLKTYVSSQKWRTEFDDGSFSWASLANFWCVKERYLARKDANQSTFNQIVGRDQRKLCKECNQDHLPGEKCPKTKKHPVRYSDDNPTNQIDAWLAGRQQESKKVFSFKEPPEARRTFGFVNPSIRINQRLLDFDEIRRRLREAWPDFDDSELLKGQTILQSLLSSGSGGTP